MYLESSQVAAWLRPYFLHTLVTNIDFDFFYRISWYCRCTVFFLRIWFASLSVPWKPTSLNLCCLCILSKNKVVLLRPRNVQFVFFLSAWSRQVFVSCCQCAETTGVCAAPRWYTADTDSPSRSIITSLRSHSQLCSLYTLPVCKVCVLFICLCLLCVTLSAHWHEFCLTWYANQKTWGRVVLIAWWLFELWFCVVCVCVWRNRAHACVLRLSG